MLSWPAIVQGNRESWETVVTTDFLPTIMDVLDVKRPASQQDWAMDGVSLMPLLRDETVAVRGVGWMFDTVNLQSKKGYGFRYGNWKYVYGSVSCRENDCEKDLLYDLSTDLSEVHDLSAQHPDVLTAIKANFTTWYNSVIKSMKEESKCSSATNKLHFDDEQPYAYILGN